MSTFPIGIPIGNFFHVCMRRFFKIVLFHGFLFHVVFISFHFIFHFYFYYIWFYFIYIYIYIPVDYRRQGLPKKHHEDFITIRVSLDDIRKKRI